MLGFLADFLRSVTSSIIMIFYYLEFTDSWSLTSSKDRGVAVWRRDDGDEREGDVAKVERVITSGVEE